MNKFIKKNRNMLLIIGLLFLIYGYSNDNNLQATFQPQSVCDDATSITRPFSRISDCHLDGCVWNPNTALGDCLNCLPDGTTIYNTAWVKDYPSVYPSKMCCSGRIHKLSGDFLESESWTCAPKDSPLEDIIDVTCDESTMKGKIGKAVKGVFPDTGCDSAFYIGIGIVMMFLIMILSVL